MHCMHLNVNKKYFYLITLMRCQYLKQNIKNQIINYKISKLTKMLTAYILNNNDLKWINNVIWYKKKITLVSFKTHFSPFSNWICHF